MKTRLAAGRLIDMWPFMYLANYLRYQHNFSRIVAEALSEDR